MCHARIAFQQKPLTYLGPFDAPAGVALAPACPGGWVPILESYAKVAAAA